jgi:Glycosyl transferase family 11
MSRNRIRPNKFGKSHRGAVQVKLQGGLGNQLFQFATGLSLSKTCGLPILLDSSSYTRQSKRSPELHLFGIPLDRYFQIEERDVITLSTFDESNSELQEIRELHFHYEEIEKHIGISVINRLIGYWQSPLYWQKHQSEIREFLRSKLIKSYYQAFSIVHIRRGDFFYENPTNDYHGILPFSYYKKALELLPLNFEKLYIISDSTQEAQSFLAELEKKSNRGYQVKIFHGTSFECLSLMSMAKSIVVANSSFSWWGAYLGESSKVIAPRQYFSDKILRVNNTCDLFPKEWILL